MVYFRCTKHRNKKTDSRIYLTACNLKSKQSWIYQTEQRKKILSIVSDADCRNECDVCALKLEKNESVLTLIRAFESDPIWDKTKIR